MKKVTTSGDESRRFVAIYGRSHIILFDGIPAKLPIKRVIVGASMDQSRNCGIVRALVGAKIPISCSATPFIERG